MSNKKENSRTLEEARQNQMLVKGWLLSVTPDDATLIHFDSDLDAGSVVGRFQSNGAQLIRNRCPVRLPGMRPQWFPEDLGNARTTSDLEHDGYEVFDCPQNFILAARAADHMVFYWSVRNDVAH